MTIAVGDHLPQVEFLSMTADGAQKLSTDVIFAGRKVVLFALPGAFTGRFRGLRDGERRACGECLGRAYWRQRQDHHAG